MPRVAFNSDDKTHYSINGVPKLVKLDKHRDYNDEEEFLNVVKMLLVKQRKYAWDHEAHDSEHAGKDEMFYGAALLKTANDRYYLTSNIHMSADKTSRDCAEKNGTTEAAQEMKADKLQIEQIWFMGGKGNYAGGTPILPEEYGKRYSPCGSCLELIRKNKLKNGSKTKVHMFPLNDGSWHLKPDDGGEELQNAQVKTRTIEELFPHLAPVLDEEGKLKDDIEHGWKFLNDKGVEKAVEGAHDAGRVFMLERGEQMDKDSGQVLKDIHHIMMVTLAEEYQRDNMPDLKRAVVAIVRTTDGTYHMGVHYDDGRTVGTPSASLNAIQNAGRRKVTDTFVMTVNMRDMPEMIEQFNQDRRAPVEPKVPAGDVLDRINKARPKGTESFIDFAGQRHNASDGTQVHLMQINNPKDFDVARDVISRNVSDFMPDSYVAPKMQAAR